MKKEIKYILCKEDGFQSERLTKLLRNLFFAVNRGKGVDLTHPVLTFAMNFHKSSGFTLNDIQTVKVFIRDNGKDDTVVETITLVEKLEALTSGATLKRVS